MRRLVLLTAVAVMAITAVAYAVDNTVVYKTKMSHKGTPSLHKPANLSYEGILNIDTNPPGEQPEVAPTTEVYFAKAIVNNAKYFPSCKKSDIDGKEKFPSKCNSAKVGSGTARALAGAEAGQPTSSSIPEDLTVTAVNGNKGKDIFLVLNATSPVAIQNRVVDGEVVKTSGQFGFKVVFRVPKELQENSGLKVSLVKFDVKIPGTVKKVKVGKVYKKISYLQTVNCKAMPAKAVAHFTDKDTGQDKPVESPLSTSKC